MVPVEFWEWAVPQVKEKYPDLIFIAEVYNPNEYKNYLFRGKFDYLYDKVRAVGKENKSEFTVPEIVEMRPPALCEGCGHRDMYTTLTEVLRNEYPGHKVFSDIGCYTLGANAPFNAINSCVDMGASITMAKGASDAGVYPAVAVIGDSTFTHSGMTGLLDCINENSNVTIVISDNETTAMTGGQDSAALYINMFSQRRQWFT